MRSLPLLIALGVGIAGVPAWGGDAAPSAGASTRDAEPTTQAAQPVARPLAQVGSLGELAALAPARVGASVWVAGHAAAGDGGEGHFVYLADSRAATNLGTVLQPVRAPGRWHRQYAGPLNLRWFGAKGDGRSDDTPAVTNAYESLDDWQGGTLLFPAGEYLINLKITKNHVRLLGEGGIKRSFYEVGHPGAVMTRLLPFDRETPCLQVGDDTRMVYGFELERLRLYGYDEPPHGRIGLLFTGGAYEAFLRDVVIDNFVYGFVKERALHFPTSTVHWNGGLLGVANVPGAAGILATNRPGEPAPRVYVSNFNFSDLHGTGRTNGWVWVGTGGDHFVNCYFDVADGHGFYFQTTRPYPNYGLNLTIDSTRETGAVITDATNYFATSYFRGVNINVEKIRVGDGAVLKTPADDYLGYYALMEAPQILGSLSVIEGAADRTAYRGGGSAAQRISASSGSLWLSSLGGSVHVETPKGNLVADNGLRVRDGVRVESGGVGIGTSTPATLLDLQGGLTLHRTAVHDGAYSVEAKDLVLGCDSSQGAITLRLPPAVHCAGRVLVIADEAGAAATHPITVSAAAGEAIDRNDKPVVLTENGRSLRLYSTGERGWKSW